MVLFITLWCYWPLFIYDICFLVNSQGLLFNKKPAERKIMRTLLFMMNRRAAMVSYLREAMLLEDLEEWRERSNLVEGVASGETTFEKEITPLLDEYRESGCLSGDEEGFSKFASLLPLDEIEEAPESPRSFFFERVFSLFIVATLAVTCGVWHVCSGFKQALGFGLGLGFLFSLVLSTISYFLYRRDYPMYLREWEKGIEKIREQAKFLDEIIRYAVAVEKSRQLRSQPKGES